MKNSKNLKEFFANTKASFKGKCGSAFLATLISVLPFAIILISAAWLSQYVHALFGIIAVIALVLFGNMQVGHIRYMRALATSEEKPSYKLLFSGFGGKYALSYLFLGVVLAFIYIFATILFIVPLFLAIGAFSMVFYFVEHHNYDNFLDALSVSEKRMRRQKANMFAYKAIFYIVYFFLFALFAVGLVYIAKIEITYLMVIAMVVLHIAFVALFVYITELLSMCNYNFFEEVLEYHERKSRAKAQAVPEIKEEEPKAEDVKLEKVEADNKAEEEPKAKKTSKKEEK